MLEAIGTIDGNKLNGAWEVTFDTFVALIESRPFLQECLRRSMQSAFSVPVVTFSSLGELRDPPSDASAAPLVVLSLIEASREMWASALKALSDYAPNYPVVILAPTNDVELARAAIQHGAKGYVPVTMDFDVAVEAIRFVLVGGTFAPIDYLLAASPVGAQTTLEPEGILSARERSVVSAIKKGMANKAIAYDLKICESTVKVHVRNVMKKLGAKNRTDVAIRA